MAAMVTTSRPPPAETLQGAQHDQLGHVLRNPAQRGADEEQHDGRLQHDLATEQVAELAIERHDDGRGQQVRGDDPRQVVEPAEFTDDGGQRRRDDGLVKRREQHHQQQCRKQQAKRRMLRACRELRWGGGTLIHGMGTCRTV
jgi:hypothetical protein